MKTPLCMILLLRMALVCPAAEIVAWKVPLSRFAGSGMQSEGMVRCKAAPEASPFFKDGDELWDLKGMPVESREVVEGAGSLDLEEMPGSPRKETSPPLEWVIWNATSGRLVVKADQESIWQLGYRLQPYEQPKQCRLTAEILEVPADGGPPVGNSKVAAHLSWVTRSAQEFEVGREGEGGMIRVKGNARMDEDSLLADMRMDVTCSIGDQPEMKVSSSFAMLSGKPIWLARDSDGTAGMDVRISASFELLDGTPVSETMRIQKGNVAVSVPLDRHEFKKYQLEGRGTLAMQYMTLAGVMSLSGAYDGPTDGEWEMDPFADPMPEELRKEEVVEVRPPEAIRTWFDGSVWDLRSIFRKAGLLEADSKAFAGYDPRSKGVFLFLNDPCLGPAGCFQLDKFQALLSTGCNLQPKNVVSTFEGKGGSRLVSKSGERCLLERYDKDHQVTHSLILEPTISEGEDVEMRIDYRDEASGRDKQLIKSVVTLDADQPSALLGESSVGGRPTSIRLRAAVQGVYD